MGVPSSSTRHSSRGLLTSKRAPDEIKEELDGLLARVDQLPNFQDIQEEQRMLTQDDRWKVFLLLRRTGPAPMATADDARAPPRSSNRSPA